MRILGVDCGTEITGYGVVETASDGSLMHVESGAIRMSARDPLPERLVRVFEKLRLVIEQQQPDTVAIEDVFYAVNVKSALKLGQVRGVAMLAASLSGLPVSEYAPLSIKSAVVGYGKADKAQVQHMVARLLRLQAPPGPPDVADALAIAICHLHTSATFDKQGRTVATRASRPTGN
jgi:crossover junction endodeoxyribonuclease RuvC